MSSPAACSVCGAQTDADGACPAGCDVGALRLYDWHGTPISLNEWGAAYEDYSSRVVARTELGGDLVVVTVWLGYDDDYPRNEPPLIFGSVVKLRDQIVVELRASSETGARTTHDMLVATAPARFGGEQRASDG